MMQGLYVNSVVQSMTLPYDYHGRTKTSTHKNFFLLTFSSYPLPTVYNLKKRCVCVGWKSPFEISIRKNPHPNNKSTRTTAVVEWSIHCCPEQIYLILPIAIISHHSTRIVLVFIVRKDLGKTRK